MVDRRVLGIFRRYVEVFLASEIILYIKLLSQYVITMSLKQFKLKPQNRVYHKFIQTLS